MNPLIAAWETTVDDVENVLASMGKPIGDSEAIFDGLDCEDVAKAALDSGTEFQAQLDGAYKEIEAQIREKGLVKE